MIFGVHVLVALLPNVHKVKKILDFLHSANFGEQTNKETCSENYKNVLKCMIFVIFRARLFVSLLPKARVVKKTDDFLQFANFGE